MSTKTTVTFANGLVLFDVWIGPPLQTMGHQLHGAVPLIHNGKHIGWLRAGGRFVRMMLV